MTRLLFASILLCLSLTGCATVLGHPHDCNAPAPVSGMAYLAYDRTSRYDDAGHSSYCGLQAQTSGHYVSLEKYDMDAGSEWTSPEAGGAVVPAGKGTITYGCGDWQAGNDKRNWTSYSKMHWHQPVNLQAGKVYRMVFNGWAPEHRCGGDPSSNREAAANMLVEPACGGRNVIVGEPMCSAKLVEVPPSAIPNQ